MSSPRSGSSEEKAAEEPLGHAQAGGQPAGILALLGDQPGQPEQHPLEHVPHPLVGVPPPEAGAATSAPRWVHNMHYTIDQVVDAFLRNHADPSGPGPEQLFGAAEGREEARAAVQAGHGQAEAPPSLASLVGAQGPRAALAAAPPVAAAPVAAAPAPPQQQQQQQQPAIRRAVPPRPRVLLGAIQKLREEQEGMVRRMGELEAAVLRGFRALSEQVRTLAEAAAARAQQPEGDTRPAEPAPPAASRKLEAAWHQLAWFARQGRHNDAYEACERLGDDAALARLMALTGPVLHVLGPRAAAYVSGRVPALLKSHDGDAVEAAAAWSAQAECLAGPAPEGPGSGSAALVE